MHSDPDLSSYTRDPGKIRRLLKKAVKKSRRNQGALESVWDNLHLMVGVVADWSRGKYRHIPYGTIITVILGIAYFVMPADSIPDFIPGVGLIDDVTILSYIAYHSSRDLDRYRRWKARESNCSESED